MSIPDHVQSPKKSSGVKKKPLVVADGYSHSEVDEIPPAAPTPEATEQSEQELQAQMAREAEEYMATCTKAAEEVVPKGWKILVALPRVKETTDGGIYKGEQQINQEQVSTVTGFVLALGPDAYHNKARFPSGAYCSEGDWVVFRAYSGTRIDVDGKEFRLINDDSVEAVAKNPESIAKIGLR